MYNNIFCNFLFLIYIKLKIKRNSLSEQDDFATLSFGHMFETNNHTFWDYDTSDPFK